MTAIIKKIRLCCLGLGAVVSVVLTGGCFGSKSMESGPEDVVANFYSALNSGDFETAGSHCDAMEMKGYLDNIRSAWESKDSAVAAILPAILSETEVNVSQMTKSGENRTVFYTLTARDGRQKEKAATLGKDEGIWKIKAITDRH